MTTITIKNNTQKDLTTKIELISNVLKDIEHRNREDKILTVINGELMLLITMEKGKNGIRRNNAHENLIRVMSNEILGLAHIHTTRLNKKQILNACEKLNLNQNELHIGGLLC